MLSAKEIKGLGLCRNIATLHSQFQDPSISEADGEVILGQIRELQDEVERYAEGRL